MTAAPTKDLGSFPARAWRRAAYHWKAIDQATGTEKAHAAARYVSALLVDRRGPRTDEEIVAVVEAVEKALNDVPIREQVMRR